MLAPPVTRAAPLQKTTRWVQPVPNESRWVDSRAQAGGFGRRSPLRRPRGMPLSKRVNPIAKKTRCAASEGFLRAARVGPLAGGGSISEPQPAGFRTSGVAVAPPAFPVRSLEIPCSICSSKARHRPAGRATRGFQRYRGGRKWPTAGANSLQISLIQGISAETGSHKTRPTATYLRATGNGGFFFEKSRVARPAAGWSILCLHKAEVDGPPRRGHSHIQGW